VDDLVVFVICTYRECFEKATGNLMAPIVVNGRTRWGQQIIFEGTEYTTHESVAAPVESASANNPKANVDKNCG
jgi:flagellar assembly factor FliW